MVDVDKFKKINDIRGHFCGDEMLRMTGSVILRSLRGTDTVDRWGGDEFVIVLAETKLKEGMNILERVRQAVCEMRVHCKEAEVNVMVTIGAAEFKASMELSDLINRADELMYQGKKQENCVVGAGDEKKTQNDAS